MMTMFGKLLGGLGVMILGAAPVLPAMAEELSVAPVVQEGNGLVLNGLGHVFELPLPDWLSPAERLGGDVLGRVNASYRADAKQGLLEIYPSGQTQEQWTTLFGARITLDAGRPLTDYRRAVMYGYSQTCKPELTGFFNFGQDNEQDLPVLAFVCGAYLDSIKGYAGLGEVMIVSFSKTDKATAIAYQEWKGAAFDPSEPATWPVGTETLKARAEQLKAETALTQAD